MKSLLLASACAVALLGTSVVRAEESYGLNNQGHYIPAYSFTSDDPGCALSYSGLYFYSSTGTGGSYCGWYEAPLGLPEGAKINSYAVFFYDNDATNDLSITINKNYMSYSAGSSPGVSYVSVPNSSFTTSSLTQAYEQTGYSASINQVVDTYTTAAPAKHQDYAVRLVLPAGSSLRFRGVWVFWTRQVAPAPSVATFNDVPTSHPFFNEIQQLSKAGITSGCGGGAYCPDSAVTRGQMAVFLSRSLGLQWDYYTEAL